ncbi:MAG TPA: NAD(P)-binding protein [bacterium]|nr:NAD(P)-binding protein [bacterium]
MPKVVKKAKKKLGAGRISVGLSVRETSNLRPRLIPKIPPCMGACPNSVPVREALMTISLSEAFGRTHEDSLREAWKIITHVNPLPAICGRICPHPCETECNRSHLEGAVAINDLERFIGDYGIQQGLEFEKPAETYRERIAVIGSGPAGLSCAYHLARRGYPVTIFEAFVKPGGMLRYGIPAYRLPRDILDAEINRILNLGVELKCSTVVGRDVSLDDLKRDYRAVFIGIGAHKGVNLHVEGEDASNVFTGAEFLNRVNSGEEIDVGDRIVVIGGGDSAIDAARVSKRLGAEATILYRRTIKEMPAIADEIHEAEAEGIRFEFLAAPVAILRDASNGAKAIGMRCIRMKPGEPDESGRPRPVPITGSEFEVEATAIIAAISQEPDFTGFEQFREGRDWIKVDEDGKTRADGAYAGGDALELGLVTVASCHGRRAAAAIHAHFRRIPVERDEQLPLVTHDGMKLEFYEEKDRVEVQSLPVAARFASMDLEITPTLCQESAIEETKRCMSCGMCFDCGTCWSFCQDNAIIKPQEKGQPYSFKMEFCQGCKKCAEECPCGFIEME